MKPKPLPLGVLVVLLVGTTLFAQGGKLQIQTDSLPAGTVGTQYSQTFRTSGGSTSPLTWSVASGSLPAGLTLSSGGVLAGTPSASGTFDFTVRVVDSSMPPQSVQKPFRLNINSAPLSITSSSPLPPGTVGTSYSQTFAATGGTAPYAWSLTSGSLPQGMNLSSGGVISGTPRSDGSFNFTIRVTDNSATQQSAQKAFALTVTTPVSITTGSTLPPGIVGTAYSQTFAATGGTSPYIWSLDSGSLPQGINLSTSGLLSGTPTAEGSFNFTIRVMDSSTVQQTTRKAFNLTVMTPLSITTNAALPSGSAGTPYSQTLNATGGTPPYTWSLVAGSLPAGLSLTSTGTLRGTTNAAGTFNFTIGVEDSGQQNVQKAFSLAIVSVGTPLSITTSSPLPSGIMGVPYSTQLQAAGGTGPYRWSVGSGALAQGLTLSSDGLLSGTPTVAGSASFTIQVTDRSVPQQTANQSFTLTIGNPTNLPSLTLTSVPGELDPTQQQPIGLALSAAYPAPLSGTLTLSFTSNAAAATDDPLVMFSTGSRTVSFTIPANSRTAIFPSPVLLLAGTVAGSINLTASLQGNQPQRIGSVTVRLAPPQVKNIVAVRTQGGLTVAVTGYSPDRTVQRVDFQFGVRTTAGIESVGLTRSVDVEFQNWYRSPASTALGSSFVYTQSFVVQGDVATIQSVTVSLSNAQGSTSANAMFGN